MLLLCVKMSSVKKALLLTQGPQGKNKKKSVFFYRYNKKELSIKHSICKHPHSPEKKNLGAPSVYMVFKLQLHIVHTSIIFSGLATL